MKVYIIVVNWNGRENLLNCLKSLRQQVYPSFKIVVVDNGSKDGSVELMKQDFPDVKLIPLFKNTGFGIGNNVGIKWALAQGADAIALINNDCVADTHWLSHLVASMKQDSSVGACAAQLLFSYDHTKINGIGIIMNNIGFAGDNYWNKDFIPLRSSEETIGFTGGACLIRSSVLTQVGLFDPFYFMYMEDVDLSLRIWKAGFKIITVPQAIVYHQYSSTAKRFPHKVHYYGVRNHLYFAMKFFSFYKLVRILFLVSGIRIYQGATILKNKQFQLFFWHIFGFFGGFARGALQFPKSLFYRSSYGIEPKLWDKIA